MSIFSHFKKKKEERELNFLFSAPKPKKDWCDQYIGKSVQIEGKTVRIKTLVPNKWKPAFVDINGEHSMGILRFTCRMSKIEDQFSEETYKQFEDIEYEVIQKKNKTEK